MQRQWRCQFGCVTGIDPTPLGAQASTRRESAPSLAGPRCRTAPHRGAWATRAGQGGFSLTESLAAIMLVTVVILGIAAGILTAVKATRAVSETQRSEAALTNATEVVKAKLFVSCAGVNSYGTPGVSAVIAEVPAATISDVTYLRTDSGGTQFTGTCPAPNTDAAQRITIVVGKRTAEVVKRNPALSGVSP